MAKLVASECAREDYTGGHNFVTGLYRELDQSRLAGICLVSLLLKQDRTNRFQTQQESVS
jgi:hypothetical protein